MHVIHEPDSVTRFNQVKANPMLCMGRLLHVLHYALQACEVDGDYAEFGCWDGKTAALIASITGKKVWLYDSFEGLPPRAEQDQGADEWIDEGKLCARSEWVAEAFVGLPPPVVKKGWFCDVQPSELPEKIAMAHFDGDMYDSIIQSLTLAYPRMTKGAVGIVDDYGWSGAPGVVKACDDFFSDKLERVKQLTTNSQHGYQGMFVKA